MGYIAHKDGERVQTVKEHLEGTAERAGNFAEKFGNSFFDRLNGAGMLRPVSEEMQDFYELVDGEQYSEEYGLDFSLEDGMAFFV